jgi:hypothetical protein
MGLLSEQNIFFGNKPMGLFQKKIFCSLSKPMDLFPSNMVLHFCEFYFHFKDKFHFIKTLKK